MAHTHAMPQSLAVRAYGRNVYQVFDPNTHQRGTYIIREQSAARSVLEHVGGHDSALFRWAVWCERVDMAAVA